MKKKGKTFNKVSTLKDYCYLCGFTEAIERHHIKPRSLGGNDKVENLIILCPNCHTLAHKNKVKENYLLSKKIMVENITKKDNGINENGLSKKGPTKDTLTKDTITKEKKLKRKDFEKLLLDEEYITTLSKTLNITFSESKEHIQNVFDYCASSGKWKYVDLAAVYRSWNKKKIAEAKKPFKPKLG